MILSNVGKRAVLDTRNWTRIHLFAHVSLNGCGWSRSQALKSCRDKVLSMFFTQVHRAPTCSEGIETLFLQHGPKQLGLSVQPQCNHAEKWQETHTEVN